MGEPALWGITHELVTGIGGTISVGWMNRVSAKARMRVLVKRILRKYGYPPDLQDADAQKVLQEAEATAMDCAA
jgi:type I restriction enzyme R subunit